MVGKTPASQAMAVPLGGAAAAREAERLEEKWLGRTPPSDAVPLLAAAVSPAAHRRDDKAALTQAALGLLKTIVLDPIVKFIGGVLSRGIPLPALPGLQFVDPLVVERDGYLYVGSDF